MKQNKTVLFTFGNQKGGVGKSTLTTVISNYIDQATDFSVGVADADDKQQTIFHWRQEDIKGGASEDKVYDIHQIKSRQFPDAYPNVDGEYDFMAVDLPGNLLQEGVMRCYALADVVFIPLNYNETDFDSTLRFIEEFRKVDELRSSMGFAPVDKYLVFSKIDKRMGFSKNMEEIRSASPLPVLQNFFPYKSAAFGRDSQTFKIYEPNDSEIQALCKEVLDILSKKRDSLNS